LKETVYSNKQNIISRNITMPNFKENINSLEKVTNDMIQQLDKVILGIEQKQEPILKILKEQLKVELAKSKLLFEKLKSFET
jgi:hypothetical protein